MHKHIFRIIIGLMGMLLAYPFYNLREARRQATLNQPVLALAYKSCAIVGFFSMFCTGFAVLAGYLRYEYISALIASASVYVIMGIAQGPLRKFTSRAI